MDDDVAGRMDGGRNGWRRWKPPAPQPFLQLIAIRETSDSVAVVIDHAASTTVPVSCVENTDTARGIAKH